MLIPASDKPKILSYIDLCNGLHEDLLKDSCMPAQTKTELIALLEKIEQKIEPYSS